MVLKELTTFDTKVVCLTDALELQLWKRFWVERGFIQHSVGLLLRAFNIVWWAINSKFLHYPCSLFCLHSCQTAASGVSFHSFGVSVVLPLVSISFSFIFWHFPALSGKISILCSCTLFVPAFLFVGFDDWISCFIGFSPIFVFFIWLEPPGRCEWGSGWRDTLFQRLSVSDIRRVTNSGPSWPVNLRRSSFFFLVYGKGCLGRVLGSVCGLV